MLGAQENQAGGIPEDPRTMKVTLYKIHSSPQQMGCLISAHFTDEKAGFQKGCGTCFWVLPLVSSEAEISSKTD